MKVDPTSKEHKMEKDVLEIFRKVKVPWWARALGWWRSKRLRKMTIRKHHHIATISVWWWWVDKNCHIRSWYICSERGDGKRTYDYRHEPGCAATKPEMDGVYAHIVAPWIGGSISNARLVEISQNLAKQPESRK